MIPLAREQVMQVAVPGSIHPQVVPSRMKIWRLAVANLGGPTAPVNVTVYNRHLVTSLAIDRISGHTIVTHSAVDCQPGDSRLISGNSAAANNGVTVKVLAIAADKRTLTVDTELQTGDQGDAALALPDYLKEVYEVASLQGNGVEIYAPTLPVLCVCQDRKLTDSNDGALYFQFTEVGLYKVSLLAEVVGSVR